jgi:hypothetical protein
MTLSPDLLPLILLHGLVAGGFALLFRALPWPKHWISPKGVPDEEAVEELVRQVGKSALVNLESEIRFRNAWAWFWRKFWGCKACAAGRPAALLAFFDPQVTGGQAWCVFLGALAVGAFLYAHAGPMDLDG